MNAAIEANEISLVIGRTFPVKEAAEAYPFQAGDTHFGKVVILKPNTASMIGRIASLRSPLV
jgi:hypothetical protein